ncbi:hypothetical protein [Oricola sp.]|uniref:hypothetical protein n=1 Tax=Oricola sp. TaxID=1979950 RepID=UPI00320BCFB6|nr:hypothetical protein [Oricola sp.]
MERISLEELGKQIGAATGSDAELDRLIRDKLDAGNASSPRYSSSVDDCIALIGAVLPGWAWHVGHGARGIFPYASLHPKSPAGDGSEPRAEATAPTVPLALLQALVKALLLKD